MGFAPGYSPATPHLFHLAVIWVLLLSLGCPVQVLGAHAESDRDPCGVDQGNAKQRPRFLLFGDSLTEKAHLGAEGWASSLAGAYSSKADVVLRGFGGYNTRWALLMADSVFEGATGSNTLLVTIFFGTNDAVLESWKSHQYVPLDEYMANLKKMIDLVKSKGIGHIIILTPPPVSSSDGYYKWSKDKRLDRKNEVTKQYAEAAKKVAAEMDVVAVDLFTAIQEQQEWETSCFVGDGLHFAPAGNAVVFKELMSAINKSYPEILPASLKGQFPPWGSINYRNPAESFYNLP